MFFLHAYVRSFPAQALSLGILLLVFSGCASPYYADRGAALGGATGAGIGAAIGSAHDNTLAGALIGGTLGTITGAATGSAMDDMQARNQQLIEERMGRELQGRTSMQDVIEMSQAELGDEVIIQHLRTHGFAGDLSASQLVQLKRSGVSDPVLRALQDQQSSGSSTYAARSYAAPASRPIVVQEHYYTGPPLGFHGHWHPRAHCPPYRRPHTGWHIAWHN